MEITTSSKEILTWWNLTFQSTLVSKIIRIDKPREAIIFGGLLGTTSGTSAAMAAIDPALVPYAAMTATFYTGLGCLVCPSVLYFAVAAIV